MRQLIRHFCLLLATLFLAFSAGCNSSGYSTSGYYGNPGYYNNHSINYWGYDDDYRNGIDRNYDNLAGAAAVRAERGTGRLGGGGGGRGGGRR